MGSQDYVCTIYCLYNFLPRNLKHTNSASLFLEWECCGKLIRQINRIN